MIKDAGVKPVLRVPMTASYWFGVVTKASAKKFARFKDLGTQYQTLIGKMVDAFTEAGAVVILDLHWSDDDTEKTPMPFKTGSTAAVTFWDSVATKFASNDHVFYELYSDPHTDEDTYLNGDSQYESMVNMVSAVRKAAPDSVLVIAGAKDYAYDAQSAIDLDKKLAETGQNQNIMYNFHPYMGGGSADKRKTASGFEDMVKQMQAGTEAPLIVTEFGQYCCDTHGAC